MLNGLSKFTEHAVILTLLGLGMIKGKYLLRKEI